MFRKRALLPVALLVGCLQSATEAAGGEELTRSQAQQAIGAMIKTQIRSHFFIGWWKAGGRTPMAEPGMSLVQPGLLAAGLIQLGPQEREAESGTVKTLVSFTEKGKTEIETYPGLWTKTTQDGCGYPDLKDGVAECWTVAAAERRLLRLIDFEADANEAVVEYAWRWIATPYTEILGAGALVGLPSGIERPSSIRPNELAVWTAKAGKARATFRKFPEGWRILQPEGGSDSPSEWAAIQQVIDLASAPVTRHQTTIQNVSGGNRGDGGAESGGKRESGCRFGHQTVHPRGVKTAVHGPSHRQEGARHCLARLRDRQGWKGARLQSA